MCHTIAAIEPFERSLDRDRRVYITQLVAKATTLAKEAIPMRVEKAHENWLWPLDRQQRDPVAMDREGRHDELLSTLHVQTQIVNSARDVVEAAQYFFERDGPHWECWALLVGRVVCRFRDQATNLARVPELEVGLGVGHGKLEESAVRTA